MKTSIFNMKDQLSSIINNELSELLEKRTNLESSIKSYNYKNTHVVGEILTNEYPIKPKKKLIVVVSFITSFILSIFFSILYRVC